MAVPVNHVSPVTLSKLHVVLSIILFLLRREENSIQATKDHAHQNCRTRFFKHGIE